MNLLASTLIGGLYLLILFGLCFSVVVGVKAVRIELRNRKKNAEKPEESEKPKAEPALPKPREKNVYYIVEKSGRAAPKRRRARPNASNSATNRRSGRRFRRLPTAVRDDKRAAIRR